jgi:hypothetical protein
MIVMRVSSPFISPGFRLTPLADVLNCRFTLHLA